MIEWLQSGGPVMIPIALCSVVALAAFFERSWALRRRRVVPQAFCVEVVELVRQGRHVDALTACKKWDTAVSRVLEVVIESRAQPRSLIKERAEEIGRREAAELERYLPVLGTIASLGPLLGLLGTVSGMILTFDAIRSGGIGDMQAVAGGIGQALITTFGGLVVAIPTVVAHRYLLARVDGLVLDLEEVAIGVIDLVAEESAAQEAAK